MKNELNICVQSGQPKEHNEKGERDLRVKKETRQIEGKMKTRESENYKPQGRTVETQS
jgi:hypothetical protein